MRLNWTKINKLYKLTIILLVLLVIVVGCGQQANEGTTSSTPDESESNQSKQEFPDTNKTTETRDTDSIKNPIVTILMENNEEIKIELYPEVAPNTVTNFISLVNQGFYDGVIFHRVIPGFMIQGGDPQGIGIGGPGYSIKGEFTSNGFENNLKHELGVLSMARTQAPNSAGSQFFIMVADVPSLDGDYAAFGKVIDGMETVQNIALVDRGGQDKPIADQVMKKVTVDTLGIDYGEPKKVE
jgi:peptidyl-prolyl cis-trans isomerase B (cyclophilin B)